MDTTRYVLTLVIETAIPEDLRAEATIEEGTIVDVAGIVGQVVDITLLASVST